MAKWKDIPGFPNYQASDAGEIRRKTKTGWRGVRLHLAGGRSKYYYANVKSIKGPISKSVHRLVALTFLGPMPVNLETSHINEDRFDNRACNLCYETREENNSRPMVAIRQSAASPIGASGYRGVVEKKDGRARRYEANFKNNGKNIYVGVFHTAQEAATAWDKKVVELRGDGAATNKKLGLI